MSFEISAGRIVRSDRERRQGEYARRVGVSDLAVVGTAVAVAQISCASGPHYTVVSVLLVGLWSIVLSMSGTRSLRAIGSGTEESRRVVTTSLKLFGGLAIASMMLGLGLSRAYLIVALLLGVLGLLAERRAWHLWVARQRAAGAYRTQLLVVGEPDAAQRMAAAFARDPGQGYEVIGVCTAAEGPLPVLEAVRRTGAEAVAITATGTLVPADFRSLAWELDDLGVELLVAPALVGIAGTRLTHRIVADTPVLHVEKPQYGRAKSMRKNAFDFCFALTVLLAIAPALLVIAVAIKATSRGPVLYLSERIGRDGRPFQMFKFRSMYADAGVHIDALLAVGDDPRMTPVGRVIRRYRLDELPQFLNVLRGEMSIVGPRPQVRLPADALDEVVRRSLLVRPGLTGLWQVSGRSYLAPEDAMRLDLSYVENWSAVLDLLMIAKSIGAVTRRGAL